MRRMLPILGTVAILALPSYSLAATFTLPLSLGSRGAEVSALQHMLATIGYFSVGATGYFGPLTKQAVIRYQKASGLEPVGIVGPKTRALLNALVAQPGGESTGTNTSPAQPAVGTASTPPESGASATAAPSDTSSTTAGPVSSATSSPDTLIVTLVSPPSVLPVNTLNTSLTVKTNKEAVCRWSTIPNSIFSTMTLLIATGGTTHTYAFTNLSNGYWYVYYVKCQDNASLTISADTLVSFTISWQSSALSGYTFSYVSILPQVAAAAANTTSFEELKRILDQILVILPALIHS